MRGGSGGICCWEGGGGKAAQGWLRKVLILHLRGARLSIALVVFACVFVHVRVRARVCVHGCVHALSMHECVHVHVCVAQNGAIERDRWRATDGTNFHVPCEGRATNGTDFHVLCEGRATDGTNFHVLCGGRASQEIPRHACACGDRIRKIKVFDKRGLSWQAGVALKESVAQTTTVEAVELAR